MTRILDLILTLFALLLLSPLLLVIMVILKCTGEGDIFYLQERIGKGGQPFYLFKFATMLRNSPDIGSGLHTLESDPRVFPFGKWLRRTKLNEIAQLLNVIKGDMGIIGPRPQVPPHFEVFPEHVKKEIIKVKPGLSGIGSIVFCHEQDVMSAATDHEALYEAVIAPYKGELEIWFVNHYSLYVYFMLIVLTIWTIINSNSTLYKQVFKNLPPPPEAFIKLFSDNESLDSTVES